MRSCKPYRFGFHTVTLIWASVLLMCANQHLTPELLGVYPMPGGFNQVQSLAQNSNACSISSRLQRWSTSLPCVTTLGNASSSRVRTCRQPSHRLTQVGARFCPLLLVTPAICSQSCLLSLCRWTCSCWQTHGRVWSMQHRLSLQTPN